MQTTTKLVDYNTATVITDEIGVWVNFTRRC